MDLTGTWENEFGSVMEITVNEKGVIEGTYQSHTGATGTYRVVGLTDTDPVGESQTVALAVSWRDLGDGPDDPSFHWVSGFAGQLQLIDGEEVLTTTYLLTKNTEPEDNWEATAVDKSTFKRINKPQTASGIVFDLARGRLTDNGATPWYATVGLGTPAQNMKFMIDTGTTHTWVTSVMCSTKACKQHGQFNQQDSSTYEALTHSPKPIDFGPWGKMQSVLGQDYLTLAQSSGDFAKTVVLQELRLYLSTYYEGSQFQKLACDGGIAVPRILPYGIDSSELLPLLKKAGIIDQAIASFWFDAASGKGEARLGAVDRSRFEELSLNRVTVVPFEAFSYLWAIPLQSFECGGTPVLSDIPFALDTGSSRFKGDEKIIEAIKSSITDHGKYPEHLCGRNPDFSPYPDIALKIDDVSYPLKPNQYFMEVKPGVWELAFHTMEGLDGLLVVGSLFLDTVYSIFYYETDEPGLQEIGLATPIFDGKP